MNQRYSSSPSEYRPHSDGRSSDQSSPVPGWALLLGASALAAYGLTRRSKTGSSLASRGADLASRGASLASKGSALAFSTAKKKFTSGGNSAKVTFLINTTPDEAYRIWHNFADLPRFMTYLESVRVLDSKRSEWTAKGPMDSRIRWSAEITEDSPGRRIAWQSLPGSDITNKGSVEFRTAPDGRGTFVTSNIVYSLPGGSLAKAFISALGKNPEFIAREDLRHFKALVEAGEIATTRGQTHGPRSLKSKAHESLLREDDNMPEPQASSRNLRTA